MNKINSLKLKPNNSVAIIAPARNISTEQVEFSIKLLESWGLKICFGRHLFGQNNQFAGTITQRVKDLQWALDDSSIKGIFFARGGYGSIQVLDYIDWTFFKKKPKWLIGFSDITVFHAHIQENLSQISLHAPMPITFHQNSKSSLSGLKKILFGKIVEYHIPQHPLNRRGVGKGELVGGNLSILYSLLGSKSQINTKGKILFIEDVDEYLYHIDRMMYALLRAGMLNNLSGLIVGSMSRMNDNKTPFGKTSEEIIYQLITPFEYPTVFGFPAGHIKNNQPLVMGKITTLNVIENKVIIR